MTLEADGIIDVWEIETGKVVAQYEGLEVQEDMQSIPDMKRRITELEATVSGLEAILFLTANHESVKGLKADLERMRNMPLDAMRRYFLYSTPADSINIGTYSPVQADADMQDVGNWLFSQDGDA